MGVQKKIPQSESQHADTQTESSGMTSAVAAFQCHVHTKKLSNTNILTCNLEKMSDGVTFFLTGESSKGKI